jgi:hypothetical protein
MPPTRLDICRTDHSPHVKGTSQHHGTRETDWEARGFSQGLSYCSHELITQVQNRKMFATGMQGNKPQRRPRRLQIAGVTQRRDPPLSLHTLPPKYKMFCLMGSVSSR